jgi:hypothetical protein
LRNLDDRCQIPAQKHWRESDVRCYDKYELVIFGTVGDFERIVRTRSLRRVRMKRIVYLTLLYVSAAILLSIGVSMNSSQAADSPQITIAYSSNMMGYMEPCG